MDEILTGKVIKVINEYKLVINKGADDGVSNYNRFLVYRLGDELFDPDTEKSLGLLEIVCGEGKPEHIQQNFTTIVTCKEEIKKSKTIVKHGGNFYGGTTEETIDPQIINIPFENADTDCLFKQIK